MQLRLLCALLVLAAVGLARPAAAEINVADSLEWMTADADLIVRGRVTAVAAHRGPGDVTWYDVSVGVDETLKGAAPRKLVVAIRDLGTTDPAVWMAKRQERLWFLVRSARRISDDAGYKRDPFALRPHDGASLLLGPGGDRAYSASFAVLSTRDEILAAVRAASTSKATEAIHVDVPFDAPAFKALWAGSSVWLWVPVDARLEKLALGWVTDKDLWRREEGVLALAHFRTAANIAVVERLLADPEFATVTESGKPPIHRYLVREQADQVLTGWAVAHRTPVIDEPASP